MATLAPLVRARNCTPDLNYCGSSLQSIAQANNYDQQIREQLVSNGHIVNEETMQNSLFFCKGGPHGEIVLRKICNVGLLDQCNNMGLGRDDRCNVFERINFCLINGVYKPCRR
ncbi:hypothetical protein CP532_3132 [Ophiocordyceps camponoti-leonardi (nom. inval.)]|nr:hypothetical protein CP532_3132 [Ophiocordyceps camponoti-leonardi (nom. inval.)]